MKATFRSDQCCKESTTRKQENLQEKSTRSGFGYSLHNLQVLERSGGIRKISGRPPNMLIQMQSIQSLIEHQQFK